MKTCEDCGCKLQRGVCPNCEEETVILEQYFEQGMKPPPDDSEFMRNVSEQEKRIADRDLNP